MFWLVSAFPGALLTLKSVLSAAGPGGRVGAASGRRGGRLGLAGVLVCARVVRAEPAASWKCRQHPANPCDQASPQVACSINGVMHGVPSISVITPHRTRASACDGLCDGGMTRRRVRTGAQPACAAATVSNRRAAKLAATISTTLAGGFGECGGSLRTRGQPSTTEHRRAPATTDPK